MSARVGLVDHPFLQKRKVSSEELEPLASTPFNRVASKSMLSRIYTT
jgi:hypothetical protein